MKIFILDRELDFNNDEREIELIFQEIDQIILNSNRILSHLDIDGIEVYENFYEYFFENIDEIKNVKAITKTSNELAKDVLLSTSNYLARALPEIEKLSNEFYKTPQPGTWGKLADLLDGIKWILDTFSVLDENYKIEEIVDSYEEWNKYVQYIYSLKELLYEFEGVLNDQDYISTADILSYEIIPLFGDMLDKINILVSEEIFTRVIN